MPTLAWLSGIVFVCALGAKFGLHGSDSALFHGEVVTRVFEQTWSSVRSGSKLSMSSATWTYDGFGGPGGHVSSRLHCSPAEFERFVRELRPFEGLFRLRKAAEPVCWRPFAEVDVACADGKHYVWVIPSKRVLNKSEHALSEYIAGRWDRLAARRMGP